jgi:predicted signal transduction protein with EAL and GGDEF domain
MMNDLSTVPARPAWREPYVWLVVGLPLSAVLACLVTAVFILRGPQRLVSEPKPEVARALAQEIAQSTAAAHQPALVGRNHSATGGVRHASP